MNLGRIIAGAFLIVMSGFMFYYMLGFGAMVLNEYFPTVETDPRAALLIRLLFLLPAFVIFIIGLWIVDEPTPQSGYGGY